MYRNNDENRSLKTGRRVEECMYFPSFLLEIPLTMTARIAYVLILNRTLNARTRRKNEKGELYCSYPTKELSAHLDRSRTATRDAIDDLHICGLIRKGYYHYNFDGIYYPLIPGGVFCHKDLDKAAGYFTIEDTSAEE